MSTWTQCCTSTILISGCKNICKKDLVKIFYICLLQFQMFLLSFWVNVKPVCMYCVLTECVNTCELAWLYARVFAPQLSIPVSFWIWSFLISALPLIAHVGECFLCSGELNSYSNNPSAFCKHLVVSLVLHEVFLLRLPKLGGMDTFFFLFFFFYSRHCTCRAYPTFLNSKLMIARMATTESSSCDCRGTLMVMRYMPSLTFFSVNVSLAPVHFDMQCSAYCSQ